MQDKPKQIDTDYYDKLSDTMFMNMLERRRTEADSHWNKMGLKEIRKKNEEQYLADYIEEQLIDERYEEVFVDNRQFTSVRSVVPFLTARITAPEVTPGNNTDIAINFARDFEEALQKHAEKQLARAKIRLAAEDLAKGKRVGVLKWRYDGALDTVVLEHLDPESVRIGKRSRLFEEPDYVGHTQEKTVSELIRMFPDKEEKIKKLFNIERSTPSQMEKIYDIEEEWIWVDIDGKRELVVGWSWQNHLFGKIKDPNWNENGKNLINRPMVPFVFFNFLNDGKGYIDNTSFIEQAKHLQQNYNKRGQVIAENAKYGGTGVPIFAKDAIAQKDVAKVKFSPIQRILLDSDDLNKSFTTWQSQNLPQFIVEDKYDTRNSIDNIWGTPNIFRGEQSKNNTLGQDVLIRNQAEGRLGDQVDCIDDAMQRFYNLEGQLMYRYFSEKKFFNYLGNDGKFVSIAISRDDIAKNLGLQINVKSGTSLPVDRAQKRSTIFELLKANRISTLVAYKELGVFDDPEAAYKQYVLEQLDPKSSLEEAEKRMFSREANEDLHLVIANREPDEREDIEEEYLQYLNEWLLTDKYKMLMDKNPSAAARVSAFIDSVIAKAQRKATKMGLQPSPDATQGMIPGMSEAAMLAGQPPQPEGGQQPPMPDMPPQPSMAGAASQPPLPPPGAAPPPMV